MEVLQGSHLLRAGHTHLSKWSHKGTLETQTPSHTPVHSGTSIVIDTKTHSETSMNAASSILNSSILTHKGTHSDIVTHAYVHDIHRNKGKRTDAHTCTLRCIHTDAKRNTLRHNHTHTPAQPRPPTQTDTKTHSCPPACTLEYFLTKARTDRVPTPVYAGTFGQPHRYTHPCKVRYVHTQPLPPTPAAMRPVCSRRSSALSPHPLPTVLWGLWGLPPGLEEG